MLTIKHRIPDALTYLRAALVPVLWLLGLMGLERLAGAALLLAAATDVLDGRLSRRWGVTTTAGSKVDAIADTGMGITALGLLVMLEPDVIRAHRWFFFVTGMAAALLLIWGYRAFGKVADLHLTVGRATGVAAFVYLILLFLFGSRLDPLFYVVMVLCWLLAVETVVTIRARGRFNGRPSPILAWWSERTRRRGGSAVG